MTTPLPPANRGPGQAGHIADHNALSAAMAALQASGGTGGMPVPSGTAQLGSFPAAIGAGSSSAWSSQVLFVPPPSGDVTGARDTLTIQNMENALAAAGSGILVFGPGTYIVTGLIKQSFVIWQGTGRGGTVIKLAAGVNAPLLVSASFASLSMSGSSSAGINNFVLRDIAFDGNAANQTAPAAAGVQIFGFDYLMDNVSVRNFRAVDGLYTEWGSFGTPGPDGGMESHFRALRVHGNVLSGAGWHNRGPHDSHVFGALIYQNTTNSYGYWAESSTSTLTASGLSGTAVSATPSTITIGSTLGLPVPGSVTAQSAGGTVTIAYTGVTSNTLTGCTATGGSGNYSSSTLTPPQYSASSALITSMHVWGNHSIGMVLDSESHMVNCEAEGATVTQVLVRSGNSSWDGGRIFLAGQPGGGLQLGDATNTATGFALNNPIFFGFQGGSAANAPINIVATASGSYKAQIFQSSGQAIYGTFQPYEPRKIGWGGLVTPAVAAAGGAGTSPPAPTLSNASDARGIVNMGTGTVPASGAQATITYAQPKPGSATIMLTPANFATASLQPYVNGNSTTGFSIAFGIAPAASQAAGTYAVAYTAATE